MNVMIANQSDFTPFHFLLTLRQKGITPNRVTFSKLIQKYCEVSISVDCNIISINIGVIL